MRRSGLARGVQADALEVALRAPPPAVGPWVSGPDPFRIHPARLQTHFNAPKRPPRPPRRTAATPTKTQKTPPEAGLSESGP